MAVQVVDNFLAHIGLKIEYEFDSTEKATNFEGTFYLGTDWSFKVTRKFQDFEKFIEPVKDLYEEIHAQACEDLKPKNFDPDLKHLKARFVQRKASKWKQQMSTKNVMQARIDRMTQKIE